MAIKTSKKNLKIVGATSIALFSLVAVFTATIAWFALNDTVGAKGQAATIKITDLQFEQMTIHKYLGSNKIGEDENHFFDQKVSATFTFNPTGRKTTFKDADGKLDNSFNKDYAYMGEYSPDKPRHPLLALIKFTEPIKTSAARNVAVSVTTEHHFLCDTNDNGSFMEPLDDDNNPLSSVVQFSASSFLNLTSNSTAYVNPETSASTNAYNFAVPSSYLHFANITVDADGALNYANKSWVNELSLINVNDGSTVLYIAVIIDYYDLAFEYIFNKYLGNPYLEQDHIPFNCDWTMVI